MHAGIVSTASSLTQPRRRLETVERIAARNFVRFDGARVPVGDLDEQVPPACGGALAITLTAAAAEAGPLQGAYSPASVSTTEATSATSYAEYRNTEWHFSLDIPSNITAEKTDDRSGTTIQFLEPTGNTLFQVSAWPYQDLDVALGEKGTPGSNSDQGDTLGIVHVFH